MGLAPVPGQMPAKTPPTHPPTVEPIRPAGGSDRALSPATPTAAPPAPTTAPDPRFPTVDIPKGLQLDPVKPPEQPKAPKPDSKPPALELPKDPSPKPPSLELPKDPVTPAVPSPAPATPEPFAPPPLPLTPDAKKPGDLPPLLLPPDSPTKPESVSRSSPLTGGRRELSVNVFPAAASEPPRGGYRTVGFYNHTDRDLALTIEGRAVKLPAKTYLHAKLAATFTWGYGDRAATRETVPDGATGIDVVFRD
jgi:hypothetical protein